ncbi:hypothetical protein QCA50_005289 [Cerrena zonata]|uniref:Major facilitator superfamily (MFS) profile domain-containing protein n=1 Tax=Cerrena zonata TaxID=2478898 RepID=A0AAW0GRJ8_9APHY
MTSHPEGRNNGYLALSSEPQEHEQYSPTDAAAATNYPVPTSHDVDIDAKHGGTLTIHPDGHSYTYSYGPRGVAGLFHNKFTMGVAGLASLGGVTFGYDQGVIANILVMEDFRQKFPTTSWQIGLITAMLELGSLIGALSAGIFADRVSRQTAILIASIVFCIGSALQFGAQSVLHLIVGRGIGGLGVGALSMLSPLYMAEISPPEVRGSLMALEQLSIVSGAGFGFWFGFVCRNLPGSASWRTPLGFQLLPGLFLGAICLFLPSSPRLLVAHGENDEALRTLARLRLRKPEEAATDPLLQIESLEMRVEVALEQRTMGDVKTGGFYAEIKAWSYLFTKRYYKRTMIGILMMVFQQWSGINALLYYGPTLMKHLGMEDETGTLVVAGGISIVQLIAVFPVILYIDRLGRRPLLRWGSVVMFLSHMTIALLVKQNQSDWPHHSTAAWTAVGCTYVFTMAYGMSYGPIGWILPSEVFPTSVRSKGVALSTSSNWINNFLIGLVTPVLMDLSPSITFIIFATACFFGYFWSTYVVPETANVSLEEIDAVFGSTVGLQDAEYKLQIERELGLTDLIASLAAGEQ